MNDLEKTILATLAYYDVFGRPLTAWEIFQYLIRFRSLKKTLVFPLKKISPDDFRIILNLLQKSPELKKIVSQKNGFYFLKGRQKIVSQRIERQKIADQKWKKIRRIAKFLQLIPFIRLVAVSGSLAMNNPRKESDIDLLIITQYGRIWTCRALTTLFIHLIGQRRHGSLIENRVCLNHYLTNHSLKIPFKSLYNAQTYVHLVPLWEAEPSLYRRFQKANSWIKNYLFFYYQASERYLIKVNNIFLFNCLRKIGEFFLRGKIGNALEFILKKIQIRRISKDPLTYQTGGRVTFNDYQLEFHPHSPERQVLKEYSQRMKKIGLGQLGQERDSGLT